MTELPPDEPLLTHALDWRARLHDLVRGRSIQSRLIRMLSVVLVLTAAATTVVGVSMIRNRVTAQAQAQVNSDLEAAREFYRHGLERLEDALRIHATRMAVYGALRDGSLEALDLELARIRETEHLDILTLADAHGRVIRRAGAGTIPQPTAVEDAVALRALRDRLPVAATERLPLAALAQENPALAERAITRTVATPHAAVPAQARLSDGMVLMAAAPVFSPDGHHLGVLYGGSLLNHDHGFVDRVRQTVFRNEIYKHQSTGTVTIFQGDVRIATNVLTDAGERAIGTRAATEVAADVLGKGGTWRGRAFVVSDWYLSAYAPIRDLDGRPIGMLFVGILQRPYDDSLFRSVLAFVGIAVAGVILGHLVALGVARRISGPIRALAGAAQQVARGDFTAHVAVVSTDELGYVARRFNAMTAGLAQAHEVLRRSADELERQVEQRTTELQTTQARLVQAEKLAAVGKLSAGVAHEINNPLGGILTISSLMLEELPADSPLRADVQTIVDETLRCRKIVKGLLDFSRQSPPHRSWVALNDVIEDSLALMRQQRAFEHIDVVFNLDPALPPARVDPDQVRQVVLNIVLNAAEAMHGTGTLTAVSRYESASDTIELRCADTGPGMPDDVKAKIFEPFFTTKHHGTGLGLSIAYGIIERHHGDLRVESTAGLGTTFVITLPRDAPETT